MRVVLCLHEELLAKIPLVMRYREGRIDRITSIAASGETSAQGLVGRRSTRSSVYLSRLAEYASYVFNGKVIYEEKVQSCRRSHVSSEAKLFGKWLWLLEESWIACDGLK